MFDGRGSGFGFPARIPHVVFQTLQAPALVSSLLTILELAPFWLYGSWRNRCRFWFPTQNSFKIFKAFGFMALSKFPPDIAVLKHRIANYSWCSCTLLYAVLFPSQNSPSRFPKPYGLCFAPSLDIFQVYIELF